MNTKRIGWVSAGIAVFAVTSAALAIPMLAPTDPVNLSNGSDDHTNDEDYASKPKLQRLGNGMLVSVFGDAAGDLVYDTKKDGERPARDLFVRTCQSNADDCSVETSWSDALNISNTAGLSSIDSQWRGEGVDALPYAGDSEKPNIFKVGNTVAVSWVDHYCPGGEQSTVTYVERDGREVPYACTYIATSTNGGVTWGAPHQLSNGERDAKQDVNRGTDAGWVVTWQEDPAGLQLGSADGPGDGASGANTSAGTDIWYSYISGADLLAGGDFSEAVRLTNNFSKMDNRQNTTELIESGIEGAARANLAMIGSNVQVAYEETKGSQGLLSGKVIRYHLFPYNQPPTSCEPDDAELDGCARGTNGNVMPALEDPVRMGCILSDPGENARRVRFFSQGTAGPNSSSKMLIFWKQGEYDAGGPSDIIARRGFVTEGETGGTVGLRIQDMEPAINVPTAAVMGDTPDGCYIMGDEDVETGAYANTLGMNLSANTELGGDLDLWTGDNPYEDARAHRGFIKGDFMVLGYSYTPDWAVARYTDQENYAFWVRTSTDGGQNWTDPVDVSSEALDEMAADLGLAPEGINIKEPRVIKTPGHGPGCPSGDAGADDTTRPTDCSKAATFVVAFGSETNVYEMLGGNEDQELFVFRSTDRGLTYEPAAVLAGPAGSQNGESQLQMVPNGDVVYGTWFSVTDGHTDALFAEMTTIDVEPDTDIDTDSDSEVDTDIDTTVDPDTEPDTDLDTEDDGGCSGCSAVSPTAPVGLMFGFGVLAMGFMRRRK